MRIYNSQSHKKKEFKPIQPPKVTFYVCGPTVYDQVHIGNARTFVSFDVCRRYLVYKGYEVIFAQNLTDVDDKIITRALEEGKDAKEIAHTYSEAFMEQMERLGVLPPDIRPRATEEISEMVKMIEALIHEEHAYATPSGDVYFSVRSVETYGAVSGRNVDELLVGARIEENAEKRDPLDFALWKAAKGGEPSWESPWGQGRPGWHTECSAMVHKYLGVPIDIHGGGSDLLFPHHENEAAQSCACWHQPLAHIWMHAGMLRVEGEKMSKSLGNYYTVKEVLDQYSASGLRLLMAQTHYRSPMDFSFERLRGAEAAFEKLVATRDNALWLARQAEQAIGTSIEKTVNHDAIGDGMKSMIDTVWTSFEKAMDDDFNTAAALAAIFEFQTQLNKWLEITDVEDTDTVVDALAAAATLEELLHVLGIEMKPSSEGKQDRVLIGIAQKYATDEALGRVECKQIDNAQTAIKLLVDIRDQARAERDFSLSDAIRDELIAAGFSVEDTAAGTRIR